jgi:hypothetical protein
MEFGVTIRGFREIVKNKSAVACMIFSFLGAGGLAVTSFAPAFTAKVFFVEPFLRGVIPVFMTSLLIVGTLTGVFWQTRLEENAQ